MVYTLGADSVSQVITQAALQMQARSTTQSLLVQTINTGTGTVTDMGPTNSQETAGAAAAAEDVGDSEGGGMIGSENGAVSGGGNEGGRGGIDIEPFSEATPRDAGGGGGGSGRQGGPNAGASIASESSSKGSGTAAGGIYIMGSMLGYGSNPKFKASSVAQQSQKIPPRMRRKDGTFV